ncbi:hypothetical protein [Enterovibrio norvegicus]|uniref:hypothetical protein n=1 Tax=Enterovibrio norvegicus TaxID=188144 RepID=UPI00352F66F8
MEVVYNIDQSLVVYKCEDGVSCFGLSLEKVQEIAPEIVPSRTDYPLQYVVIDATKYAELTKAFYAERFKVVKGYSVEKTAKKEHVEAAIQALRTKRPLFIEYEDGYEMFSDNGVVSSDGKHHVVYIGTSTGSIKTLLHMETESSIGGAAFSFHGLKQTHVL